MRTATRSLEPFICGLQSCHTEIHNLNVIIPINQDILWFKISMADVESVTAREASDQLAKNAHRLMFGKAPVLGDMFEKLTTFDIFKNEIPVQESFFH